MNRHDEKVAELFADAINYEPDERSAFLARACEGQPHLLAEVEALLSADEEVEAAGFMREPALKLQASHTARELEESRRGERIGHYEIVSLIGEGGMGEVYLARDLEFDRRVALKLVKGGLKTRAILRRFLSERQILANLQHPNIARLLDGGTSEDGLPYFVMEYVEGEPISDYAEAHRLTLKERLKLFCTVCTAVQFAHQNLIIHRDIKPSNILVTEDGTPKLLDFGIAKLLQAEGEEAELTATAARVMTPEYASPEQVKGEPVTTTSDVYSLGVLLYELLSGRRPYRVKSRKVEEVAKAICEQLPERPSGAATRRGDDAATPSTGSSVAASPRLPVPASQLKGDLDNIVLMALRKEPQRRYSSVSEFSEDIHRHLAGLPVRARKDTFGYRGAKFIRRHRAAFLSAAAAALLFLITGVALFWLIQNHKPVGSVAVLPFVNVNHDAGTEYLANGISNQLLDRLSQVPNLRVATRTAAAHYSADDPAFDPQVAGHALDAEVVLVGRLDEHDDDITASVELFDVSKNHDLWNKQYHYKMSDMLRLEDDISREVVKNLGLKLSGQDEQLLTRRYTDDVEAYQLYLKGRYFWDRRVEGSLEKSLNYYQQALAKDPNYALAYVGLAQAYDTLSYLTPPSQAYPRAEAAAQAALRLDETLPEAHVMLAILKYKYHWDHAGAEREFRRALQMDPNAARTHMYYAGFLMDNGRLDEALIEIDTALRLDPLNLVANSNKALILESSRRYAEAIEQSRKTLQIEPRLAAAHLNLATDLTRQGQFVEALGELREGMKCGGGIEYQAATVYVCALMGNRREAERILGELLRLSRQRYVQPYWLALAYVGLGDQDRAFEWLAKGLTEHSPWMIHTNVAPYFDALHADPRFPDLLHRMNLMP
ncbi:MAG TPA: protein kinase [Blastocatellia bacterium]|nr:protein kinase [Blastocatellia bacterium]